MEGAIILAAGNGTRFCARKQFIEFQGKSLWRHVYDKACMVIPKENIVVVGIDIEGGDTRTKSVWRGLQELQRRMPECRRLVLLEAARPLVTAEQIQEIMHCGEPSCTYVVPLVNTVIGRDGTYMNREDYWAMSTPNAFDFPLLLKAYESGRFSDLTDDTRVMYEYYGIKPHFHSGGENLMKITYPKDLYVLEKLAEQMER